MTATAPVLDRAFTSGDWTIAHYVTCKDDACRGCPNDDIALCGVSLAGDEWAGPGEPVVICPVCEDLAP